MRAITLMYHDVVANGDAWDASGFPDADAALYKLTREQFAQHLEAFAATRGQAPVTSRELQLHAPGSGARTPLLITFDDGGESAHTVVADMLEARGWRGHFFITAGMIDTPGFVTRAQVRDLHARGHVVGSHSFSHPARMSHCTPAEMAREWGASIRLLSDIVGESVVAASVPGGYFSREVAEAADGAGIETLFTSEPTARCRRVGACLVVGRYTIRRRTSAREAAALARGQLAPRVRQALAWNVKKATKAVGGEYYLKLRKAILSGR